jgi:hypothetical protein
MGRVIDCGDFDGPPPKPPGEPKRGRRVKHDWEWFDVLLDFWRDDVADVQKALEEGVFLESICVRFEATHPGKTAPGIKTLQRRILNPPDIVIDGGDFDDSPPGAPEVEILLGWWRSNSYVQMVLPWERFAVSVQAAYPGVALLDASP